MARVLGVSKAGYYAWLRRPPSAHAAAAAALLKRVRTVHASSRQSYGAPRWRATIRVRTRAVFDAAVRGLGVDPARLPIAPNPSSEAMRAAVEAGGGAAAMPEAVAQAGLQNGTLARVAFGLPV